MCREKIITLSQLGAEKIAFLPKPGGHTDGRTDISKYRVASLITKKRIRDSSCITPMLRYSIETYKFKGTKMHPRSD